MFRSPSRSLLYPPRVRLPISGTTFAGNRVRGFIDDSLDPEATLGPVKVIGGSMDIQTLVARHDIRRMVVPPPHRRGLPLDALVSAKQSGVRVDDAETAAYERLTGKTLLDETAPQRPCLLEQILGIARPPPDQTAVRPLTLYKSIIPSEGFALMDWWVA
jgi:hypothetical protein